MAAWCFGAYTDGHLQCRMYAKCRRLLRSTRFAGHCGVRGLPWPGATDRMREEDARIRGARPRLPPTRASYSASHSTSEVLSTSKPRQYRPRQAEPTLFANGARIPSSLVTVVYPSSGRHTSSVFVSLALLLQPPPHLAMSPIYALKTDLYLVRRRGCGEGNGTNCYAGSSRRVGRRRHTRAQTH